MCPASPASLRLVAVVACVTSVMSMSCGSRSSTFDRAEDVPATWDVEIAHASEPGQRLVVSGVVRDANGHPLADARVRAYHADAHGSYAAAGGDGSPRLAAELRTGPLGQYRLRTIVPGMGEGLPHIHFEITARGHARQGHVLNLSLDANAPAPAPPRSGPLSLERPGPTSLLPGRIPGRIPAVRDSNGVWRATADLRLR